MSLSRNPILFFLIWVLVCTSISKSFAVAKPFPCQFPKLAAFLPICPADDASVGENKDPPTKGGGFTHVFDIFVPIFVRPAVKNCETCPCGINTVCTDIDGGGRSCSCISAFIEEPGKFADDEGCTIEKTCENSPCGLNTNCTNNIQGGGTSCTCKDGYFSEIGKNITEDGCISPCENTPCNKLHTICTSSSAHQRTCSCVKSYEPIGGNPTKNGCEYTSKSCRSPYTYNAVTKRCYYFSGSKRIANYASAHAACKAFSGNLVTINNLNENNQIVAIIKADSQETWIGLNDVAREGTFVWQDRSPSSYRQWAGVGGQPDDHSKNEDCVEIRPQFGYGWNDHICSVKKAYICATAPV